MGSCEGAAKSAISGEGQSRSCLCSISWGEPRALDVALSAAGTPRGILGELGERLAGLWRAYSCISKIPFWLQSRKRLGSLPVLVTSGGPRTKTLAAAKAWGWWH